MPQIVPIRAIPNQQFTITLGGALFDITLKTIEDFTAVDIKINDEAVLNGSRTPAGAPLLPYRYEESGNFIFFSSTGQQLPFYVNFNVTQTLIYFTAEELAVFRALPPPQFNPIAALPLRYKPSGYVAA